MSTYIDYILKFYEIDIMFSFAWKTDKFDNKLQSKSTKPNLCNARLFESKLFLSLSQTCIVKPDLDQIWYQIDQFSYTNRSTESIFIKSHSESRVRPGGCSN